MNKSQVQSAVQELPTRSGRAKSDVSALRPLDKLLRKKAPADAQEYAETEIGKEADLGSSEEEFLDPDGIEEVLFGEDEFGSIRDEVVESEALEIPHGQSNASVGPPQSFGETLVEELLSDLRGPLLSALNSAERVLIEPDRVSQWLDGQARRRLLALAERLSDELQATEVKRVLTSPPDDR